MTSDTKRILMAAGFVLAAVFCIGYYTGEAVVEAGTTGFSAIRIQPTADDTTAFRVDNTSGTSMFAIDNAGVITMAGSFGSSSFTAQVGISNGTAAEPAIVFTSDDDGTGTGIYRSAANTLAISTNGVLAASINASADLAVVRDVSALGLATTTRPVSLGDGTSTIAIASTGIDISTAGAISNATTIAGTGVSTTSAPVSLGDGTSTFAVASTGVDITTAGAISNATTIACSSTITSSGTADLGWAIVDAADNAACTTGCTAAAMFGIDLAGGATAPVIVGPGDATADVCLCAGAA